MSQSSAVTTPDDSEALPATRSSWRVALPVLGIALTVLLFALHDPAFRLWDVWLNSFEYGHGMVVVPVTLYLLWLRRDLFSAEMPVPDWRGLVLTALLMAAWFVSRILGIVLVEQILLVLLLLSVTMGVVGPRIAAIAALPVLYLMFAVPVWTYISPLMQSVTAEVSAVMARGLGVPIYLEGLYMTIPDGRFLVAETCSGLRYLLAAMSLGGFYALLNLHSTWARCVILMFCVALGIVFNWIRVVGIVLIGHHSQMQSSLVGNHITYGWVLFLGVVVATLVVGRLLERLEGPIPPVSQPEPRIARQPSVYFAAGAMTVMLILGPSTMANQVLEAEQSVMSIELPASIEDGVWTREPLPGDAGWRPVFQGAQADPIARYHRDGRWVDVYLAYYPVQRQDAEVVNDYNRLFDSERWRRYSQEAVPTRVDATEGLPMSEYRLIRKREKSTRRLVWWSYWVDAQFTPDPVQAKWLQLRAALTGNAPAAALVLSTESSLDDEVARERLSAFATAAKGPLLSVLEGLAGAR